LTTIDQIVVFYFRTFREIKTYAILILINNIVRLFLIVYLLWSGFGLLGVIIGTVIVQLLVLVVALIRIRHQIGFSIPRFEHIKEYLNFGAPLTPNTIIRWITNSSDRYIVGYFLGLTAVGVYSASYTIGNLINYLTTPLQMILLP